MHQHAHVHEPHSYNRAFGWGVALNLLYVVVEAGYGFAIGSLSLLADAGHNLSDVLSLVLAWGAAYLATFPPTQHRTYGWRSSTILAALLNGLLLLIAVGGIAWEAVRRFFESHQVPGLPVIWVAAIGVGVNTATALLFLRGRERDLNIRGAFLHMAADAAVSLAVVLAGFAILWTGKTWIDPAASLVLAVVIFWGTWSLLRESSNLALQGVPEGIDPLRVEAYLAQLPGVAEVHDLHIWGMSTTQTALTAHLVKPAVENEDELLARATSDLHDQFGIEHVTLQLERSEDVEACRQACRERDPARRSQRDECGLNARTEQFETAPDVSSP
jgi:cobalt-zinc-cadmium efflux system protein